MVNYQTQSENDESKELPIQLDLGEMINTGSRRLCTGRSNCSRDKVESDCCEKQDTND